MNATSAAPCKAPGALATPVCGGDALLARSYVMPPRWPLPAIRLIMERSPGSCDFYRSSTPCCDLGRAPEHFVERSVREAIISFLTGCNTPARPFCRAADLGGNNGWMSMIMLALGANVTTVEPASDFADAIADSARLNCWSHRHRMVNAFACERDDGIGPRTCMRSRRAWQGYRAGGGPPNGLRERLRETPGQAIERLLFLDPPRELSSPSSPSSAPSSSVLGAAGSPSSSASSVVYYDLIKMDGDGPEGGWLRTIQKLIGLGRLRVGAIVMEGNHLDSTTMHRMQSVMGFTAYRLDEADGRRYITPEGWDAYSPAGTPMARLSLSRALHLRQEEVSYAPALGAAPRTSGTGAGGGAGGGAAGAAGVEASAGGETPDEGTEPGRSLKAPRDAYELEMFSIRAMRHLWRVRDNLTIAQWDVLLGPIRRYYPKESAVKQRSHVAHQWLLTTDRHLTEPTAQPRYRRHQAAVQAFHRAYHAKTNPVGGAGGAGDAAVPSFSELYV